jgi:protein O-mannosyl-transferase
MKLGARKQVFLLAAIVLGVYYTALSAGINSVDDSHIIAAYGMGAGKGLAEIFRPAGNYYYRPLIELSYYLDNLLWGMDSRSMHLENILFHLLNTLLVFLIARQVAGAWAVKSPWFPLASALLFAVHPINTESVAWIAGRTDPLAAIYVFSAIWCLLQCLIEDRLLYLWPALFLFVLGVLTKEIALCFLPVALLLAICWPGPVRVRPTVLRVLTGIAVGTFLLVLAFVTFSRSFSVTALLSSNTGGVSAALQTAFTALGFYLKKLIFPLPLNFAIDTVSTLYLIPGIAFLLLLPFWLKRRSLPALLAAVCVIFLLPAFLVSMKHVAWTPYAERYLYLPSAFFFIGLVSGGSFLLEKIQRLQRLPYLVLCVAIGAVFTTVQRNFVWHDNLTLYRDTVRKSPDFGAAHLELGVALLEKGQLQEGRAEFETAERLNKRPSLRNRIKENLMAVRLKQGDSQAAREYFYRNFRNKEEAGPEFLRLLNKADEGLASKAVDTTGRNGIYCDMIKNYDVLYRKTHDPFNLYQSGLLAFRRGDDATALAYMRKAVREAPADTHYTGAAIKWLQKLEAGQ